VAKGVESALVGGMAVGFRTWELLVLTLVLQIGMLPLMARDFHQITLAAPLVNLLAVPLTSIIVPLGFITLGSGLILPALGRLFALPLAWMTWLLLRVVQWFAHFPRFSYRIPGRRSGCYLFSSRQPRRLRSRYALSSRRGGRWC
jgi:hypothetical protein